jgi:signal transduction histidine kinase
MLRLRLRTKLLLSLLLIISSLSISALLIIRHRLRAQIRGQIVEALDDSVRTFQNFEFQRERMLERSSALLANLPTLKALMTTENSATIQDASVDFWRLAGSDLLVLADRTGKVAALHAIAQRFGQAKAQQLFNRSVHPFRPRDWWFGGGHLYEVFLQPIYFGPPADNTLLGVLAVGNEIDERIADQLSGIAACQAAFWLGNTVVVSTLIGRQQAQLASQADRRLTDAPPRVEDVQLGGERFLATSVALSRDGGKVRLTVLKSYDQATLVSRQLNRLLLGVGLVAVLTGSGLVYLISLTLTRPLEDLVAGVHALRKGDFAYPLESRGSDEIAEVTAAFDLMRGSLKKTQEKLLQSERLATIGRMASTISHELRHPLTAVLAYSEFLAEGKSSDPQRKDLYREICLAVNEMTDLIDALLELSRSRDTLHSAYGSVQDILQHAIQTVHSRREFRKVNITFSSQGCIEGWADRKKLERVFHNLLLNACQAVSPDSGKVEVTARRAKESLEIRICDNGPGIPQVILDRLFEPFVSHGKEGGTGLGLALAQKIVRDHGGGVTLESTTSLGTVFRVTLPLKHPFESTLVSNLSEH